jgi:hypothetical protein
VYTLTGARVELPDIIQDWTRKNLRTYIYPPEYERMMHKLAGHCASNEEILATMPPRTLPTLEKSTLHSDAGPAFIGLNK